MLPLAVATLQVDALRGLFLFADRLHQVSHFRVRDAPDIYKPPGQLATCTQQSCDISDRQALLEEQTTLFRANHVMTVAPVSGAGPAG